MRRVTNKDAEILQWAAKTKAHPVERSPFRPDGEPAQLGFVFGEAPASEESLRPIEWSRFFAIFHLLGLVLAYDDDRQFELLKVEGSAGDQSASRRMDA